jgi:hypothetical protein
MPFLGDTPLTALTRSLISPEIKNSVFTAVWGKSASSALARTVHVPGLQEQVRNAFVQGFRNPPATALARSLISPEVKNSVFTAVWGKSASSALARTVHVPRLQEQVRNAFFQAFGDNPSTALARSLQRAIQVPELQDRLKEVLLGFGHSDELLARPESADPSAWTESGLILPSAVETLILGGKIDVERACLTFVLTGLLLPVIMSPALAAIRDYTDWCIFLSVAIYRALGRLPKN